MLTLCDLISEAKHGNDDAMLQIINRFVPLIKKYSKKLNYEDAENDLIFNIIQIVHQMPSFNNDGNAVSYINRSVQNFCSANIKKQISTREHEILYEPEWISSQDESSQNYNELQIDLQMALKKLSEDQRKVIISKFILLKSDKDIMKELNISRQMVYKHKVKALKILRINLS